MVGKGKLLPPICRKKTGVSIRRSLRRSRSLDLLILRLEVRPSFRRRWLQLDQFQLLLTPVTCRSRAIGEVCYS